MSAEIVTTASRFPSSQKTVGDEDFPEDPMWKGADFMAQVPLSRWEMDAYYAPYPGAPGRGYARHGSWVQGVESFNAVAFGITPLEAPAMDP